MKNSKFIKHKTTCLINILKHIFIIIFNQDISILMYHSISEDKTDPWAVSISSFRSEMEWLKKNNYKVVTLEQACNYLNQNKIPKKTIVITFDDGCIDFLENAAPTLKEFGFSSTLFIPIGVVGGNTYWEPPEKQKKVMDWSELKNILDLGHSIGSHGIMHKDLTKLDTEELKKELEESKNTLQEKLKVVVKSFSYPWGKFTERETIEVEKSGYLCAVTVGNKIGNYSFTNKFVLNREVMGNKETTKSLSLKLNRFNKLIKSIKYSIIYNLATNYQNKCK